MSNEYNFLVIGGDTDGLAFKKQDSKPFTKEEREAILANLNSQMDELIRWEDEGVMKRQINIKTKNYILQDDAGKIKIKGSALKATTKEKALQRFIGEIINLLLTDKKDQLLFLYMKYARDIVSLTDITDWCLKKTVTKSVLSPERTQERRVLDALRGTEYSEGDKVYLFNKNDEELCLRDRFEGTYCVDTLLGKLHDTLSVFGTVVDVDLFPDFSKKKNKEMLATLAPTAAPVSKQPKVSKAFEAATKEVMKSHKTTLSKLDDQVETLKPQFPNGFWQTRQ